MLTLPGYAITALIYEDSTTLVYRGRDEASQAPVIIKTSQAERSARDQARLRHEYALLSELDLPGVARTERLLAVHERLFLVLNDIGGAPLTALVAAGPCPLDSFFAIALPLTATLGQLHRQHIIHKDIKPHNIIYNTQSGQIELIDFGLASRLSHEHPYLTIPDQIEGTFAYLAPEQTGRMNRTVDYRCDFYALGVTLYQLLTGQLPFQASDPLEWVHCHIARTPRSPRDLAPAIPAPLADLVLRLLAKVPEDRYQSAQGLHHDLARCQQEWQAAGQIAAFDLGARDRSDRFQIPQRLYGREAPLASLLAAFEHMVAAGAPELVLVAGYAGIGKSALVNELHKSITRAYGSFITGKVDQYKRTIPYAVMSAAFGGLVQQILAQSEERVAIWRSRLLAALGPNGQVMVDLIPQLELIIGPQAAVPELPLVENQNRFHRVFQNFMALFARPEHPLVLFLDDLQWLDSASLQLLKHLATSGETSHWLLIGAYRDNEVDAAHLLHQIFGAIQAAGTPLQIITLAPLAAPSMQRLVVDTLQWSAAQAAPLVEIIMAKTLGNPFFSIQFLSMLHREGLIAFDPQAERWTCDLAAIQAQNFTDNVVELMIGELERLPQATRRALQRAACLGNTFALAQLALINDQEFEDLAADLWVAADRGLVVLQPDQGRFLHDRIQEAAYTSIPEAERTRLHLQIGRLLLDATPDDQLGDSIFTIVSHLNQCGALLAAPAERVWLADLNLLAGRRARAATAYESAVIYLTAGMELLPEESWQSHYALAFDLHRFRAECEYLQGNGTLAEELIALLYQHARATIDILVIARLQADTYATQGRFDQAVAAAISGLRRAGLDLPPHPAPADVQRAHQAVWETLGSRPIEALLELPLVTDPEQEAILNLLVGLQAPAAFTDPLLPLVSTSHAVVLALQMGNADCCGFLYISFGIMLVRGFKDYDRGYQIAQAGYDLVEQGRLHGERAKVYLSYASAILPYIGDIRTGYPILQRAVTMALDDGDLMYAGFATDGLIPMHLLMGSPLSEAEAEGQRGIPFVRKINIELASAIFSAEYRLVQALRGQTRGLTVLDDHSAEAALRQEEGFAAYLEENQAQLMMPFVQFQVWKLIAAYLAGNYAEAAQFAGKIRSVIWASYGVEVCEYEFYAALALAAHYPHAPAAEQAEWRGQLEAHLRQLQEWSTRCPLNFACKHALVAAELARLDGDSEAAAQRYEEAIRTARQDSFIHYEAIACECAARFYAARGLERSAEFYLAEARACYHDWGATAKVRLLDGAYPALRERPAASGTSTSTSLEDLDALAIIKASQAISGHLILSELLEALLRTLLEQAGAQRGHLILVRDSTLALAASAFTEQQQIYVQALPDSSLFSQVATVSILNYVLRSREPILLADPNASHPFEADAYLLQHQPRSLLCIPIIRQTAVIGLLYLENNLIAHAFAPAQVGVLELMAAQAAISLENALLYDQLEEHNRTLEQKVALRTADLHTALARIEAHATELKGANIRLEGLLHFARFMQHEVRGYAASLEGLTPLLYEALASHPQYDHYAGLVDGIEETVAQMNGLTQRMLILTREGTLPEQQQRTISLRPLLDQIRIQALAFANRYDLPVQITLNVAEDCTVAGDPLYLGLAFFTGLRNAIEVLAEQDMEAMAEITLTARRENGSVWIQLSDNGPGFPAALLEAIQVARQSEGRFVIGWSSKTGGSGLGLALMDQVARLHGGSLTIGNHPDQTGAWINVTLPHTRL